MIADWLQAREHTAHEQAWASLGARRVDVGDGTWRMCPAGCARFAAALLGWPLDRVAWLTAEDDARGAPTATASGAVTASTLDGRSLNIGPDSYEEWRVWEEREGDRGVQRVRVDATWDDGSREPSGTSVEVIRVFVGDRAVSLDRSYGNDIYVIGDVDLAPLDVLGAYFNFQLPWPAHDPDGVRGLLAQLADELDPSFDVSVDWPARTIQEEDTWSLRRYEWRDLAIEVREMRWLAGGSRVIAKALGLPWGHELELYLDCENGSSNGGLTLRLPIEAGNRVIVRFATTPGFVRLN